MAPVPRRSALLGPNIAVNIILKADQPTGKLTSGTIATILTKGDHPRGVKVRLQSGAIGRVQSLGSSSSTTSSSPADALVAPMIGAEQSIASGSAGVRRGAAFRFQEDYRTTEPPPPRESASLADFVKVPSRNGRKKTMKKKEGGGGEGHEGDPFATGDAAAVVVAGGHGDGHGSTGTRQDSLTDQARLEADFPTVDSALIAAILGDGSSVDEARAVLAALS